MKIGLIGSVLLLGMGVAAAPEVVGGERGPSMQCEEGNRYFMEEVERPEVDYPMLSIAAPDDTHYFIQSPPVPYLSERVCDLGWLEEFVPEGPMQWFDFEPLPRRD